MLAARPDDLEAVRLAGFLQTERQRQLALGAVAGAGVYGLPVDAAARADAHDRAYAVLIRAGTDSSDAEGVVLSSARVVEQIRRAAVRSQKDIGSAVVVDIGGGRAARHQPL